MLRYPELDFRIWMGLMAPAGTPDAVLPRTKAVRALFEQDALAPVGSTPEELGAHLKREIDRYAEVIRRGNISNQGPSKKKPRRDAEARFVWRAREDESGHWSEILTLP